MLKKKPKILNKKIKKREKWRSSYIIDIYECSRDGLTTFEIPKALGISKVTWRKWQKEKPIVTEAFQRAKIRNKGLGEFKDYVFQNLTPEAKKTWEEISSWENQSQGERIVEKIMENRGKNVKQSLFVYALICSNFNPSEACRKIGIGYAVLSNWKKDPEFTNLIDEIQWIKSNYFESHLMGLVQAGNANAIMFVNRTFNRDTYGEKIEVNTKSEHIHMHFKIDDLELPLETRIQILEAIRKKKIENKPSPTSIPCQTSEVIEGQVLSKAEISNPT